MKRLASLFFALVFLSTPKIEAQGIDSLEMTSSYITLGEAWYTDYFTSYSVLKLSGFIFAAFLVSSRIISA